MTGKRVSQYMTQEKIGQGGLDAVYTSHDDRLGRAVELEVDPAGLGERPAEAHSNGVVPPDEATKDI
jgi:hypothetical protein